MLAMFPKQALLLFGILFLIGVPVGILVDYLVNHKKFPQPSYCSGLEVHKEAHEVHLSFKYILKSNFLSKRMVLVGVLLILIINALIHINESLDDFSLISGISGFGFFDRFTHSERSDKHTYDACYYSSHN